MWQVEIESVTRQFGATLALDGVSLGIAEGEMVALLGPSGCGKTTLLRCVAGLSRPDDGTIRFAGRDVTDLPARQRDVGMVFQSYALFPNLTAAGNVAFPLEARGWPSEKVAPRVKELMTLVGLEREAPRFPHELSGGQQQRVALARSLVVEPGILLLDEPLSNLDAKLRERMRTELKELQRRTGITFVYVTHDQAEALALSDQIAVIHSGRLQQFGSPDEVYTRPKNRVVADFMGHVNFLAGRMEPGGLVRLGDGDPVTVAAPVAIAPGTPVELAVRPEDVVLQPPGGAANGAMTARVAVRTFLGNINEYFVTLPSGETVRAQTPPKLNFAVGDTVALTFDAANVSVFARTAG